VGAKSVIPLAGELCALARKERELATGHVYHLPRMLLLDKRNFVVEPNVFQLWRKCIHCEIGGWPFKGAYLATTIAVF
jgi:hypothetical protein